MTTPITASSGYCTRCQTAHTLTMGSAKDVALDLIHRLDREKRLDFHLPPEKAHPRFSTDYLFGEARGKMFGIMVCLRPDGSATTLKSFSGQYNGEWEIEGWAPPLFDIQQWRRINDATEKEIKRLGGQIDDVGQTCPKGRILVARRRLLSQDLMKRLHHCYALHNFRSECRPLSEAYCGENGIPNGTGDCCGPKLLNCAALNNLQPIGLAEFYYGRANRQGDRVHGRFYPSCRNKCAPILGFMLCGLDFNLGGHREERGRRRDPSSASSVRSAVAHESTGNEY